MNPVVVIPTFVSTRSQREGGSIITTYDHPTPLSQEGELPRCLESLTKVEGIGQITLTNKDVVRHPLVQKIILAYEKFENRKRGEQDGKKERRIPHK